MSVVDLARFMDDLAAESGHAIVPFFRAAFGMDDKARAGGGFDPVTEADRAAEVTLRNMIRRNFPTHGIIGEEFGSDHPEAECTWVLDPIDGTRAFIAGLPTWGTLIGLMHHGVPVRGLMHQPYLGEIFSGDGAHALFRGPRGERALRTRRCEGLADAILATTDPRLFGERAEREGFARIEPAVRMSRYGTDCYAYCMLAAGQIDLVVEAGLKPYDIVALIPIVEGAGGVVTTWDGGPAAQGGRILAAGDRRLHAAAMALLNG
jgi:myo-inositol-1(or 4)-monophosphatase